MLWNDKHISMKTFLKLWASPYSLLPIPAGRGWSHLVYGGSPVWLSPRLPYEIARPGPGPWLLPPLSCADLSPPPPAAAYYALDAHDCDPGSSESWAALSDPGSCLPAWSSVTPPAPTEPVARPPVEIQGDGGIKVTGMNVEGGTPITKQEIKQCSQ